MVIVLKTGRTIGSTVGIKKKKKKKKKKKSSFGPDILKSEVTREITIRITNMNKYEGYIINASNCKAC